MIACSVRDILQDTRPDRQDETADLVRRYFDLVLVHGDEHLVRLEDSYPAAHRFAERIAYTGMVGPEPDRSVIESEEVFEVVVSVGGGAVGARLVETALAARPLTTLARARWLVLTGPNADGSARWASSDPDVVREVLRARSAGAAGAGQGFGVAGRLQHGRGPRDGGCRAVLVPFASGGETEQSRRAALFAARGWAVSLDEASLDPASLAAAMDRALALPVAIPTVSLDGAATTRDILARRLSLDDPAASARPAQAFTARRS